MKVHGLQFAVIGVFREGVDTFGQSEVAGDSILIPITVMEYFQSVERVDPLYVSVRSQDEVDDATARIRQLLESRHRPGSTYRVENLAGILRAARQISAVLTMVLLIIAAITLAISGIFIMNIMLISVSERTKEIGIRMAVGATRRKVQSQFLLEAVCISLLGGLVGVMLGVLVPLDCPAIPAAVEHSDFSDFDRGGGSGVGNRRSGVRAAAGLASREIRSR